MKFPATTYFFNCYLFGLDCDEELEFMIYKFRGRETSKKTEELRKECEKIIKLKKDTQKAEIENIISNCPELSITVSDMIGSIEDIYLDLSIK